MNKISILALCTTFVAIVMISSCSNKLDQPGFPGFRCDLNGTEYVADTAYYSKNFGTNIFVYTNNKLRFQFNLVQVDTTGNYILDSLGTGNKVTYYDGVTNYQSISGSLSVSQYFNDSLKMISGSFNFVGRVPGNSGNTINVSYGYFNNIPRH